MKNNWQTKKLGDICEIITGNTPKTIHKEYYGRDILWAGPSDLDIGVFVKNTNKRLSKIGVLKGGARIVPAGSVLLSCIGNIGKIGIAVEDMTTNQQINSFVPRKNILDSKFLYYALITKVEDFKQASSKMTLPIINKTKCSNIEIPLPPLSEQKRIVKILDEAFEKLEKAKENTEKNMQNSKELFESYLNNIFSNPGKDWEEKTLDEVCYLKSGTTISKNLEKKEGDLMYVKIGDMNLLGNEKYITSSSRFSDSNKVNKNQIIPIGSIIFPKRGGAILTNKRRVIIKPTIVDLNTMALVPLKVIDPEFLYYWFLTIDLNDLNNGSTIPQINNYSFDNVLINFPESMDSQKIIVKRLDQLSEKTQKLESLYKQKLESIGELKKSILQKAFGGGL